MEAFNVAFGTKVIVTDENVRIPPSSISVSKGDEITIHKTDGMYCKAVDKDGNIVYIAAWTEVKPISHTTEYK